MLAVPKNSVIFATSKLSIKTMTKIIALLNHKGGVGKSCSTQNIAAALQQLKKKVMVIDLDGQANLTESMGLSIEEPQTIYGALKGEYPLPLVKTECGITLVPACLDLSAAESELINEPGREMILRGLIQKATADNKFDYILIDCPPSLGLLTLNALTTADFIIIPVQAQFLAMRGMAKLMNVIQIVQERLNPGLQIGGIVITQYDSRKTLNKSVSELIRESFCDKVFKTFIRDNVALAEAPVRGKNIFEYSPRSHGAQDYMALAKEILKLK
jgi:chromosome partitioning protein